MTRAASPLPSSRTLILILCTLAPVANPILAKSSSASSSTTSTGSQGSSKTSAAAQSPASDGAKTPSPPGSTGGTLSIESTLLGYLALSEDARKIAEAIHSRVNGQNVIVATPADLAAILQWRIVMGQGALLHQRIRNTLEALQRVPIPNYGVEIPKSEAAVGGALPIAPADIASLIQTAASIFAVNESVSSNAASLTSTPLVNFLADELHGTQVAAVYIPGSYTPNLLSNSDLSGSFVWQLIQQLETDRSDIQEAGVSYSQARADATTVKSGKACGSPVTAGCVTAAQKTLAANFLNSAKGYVDSLPALILAIDNFESTLFTGQASSSPAPSKKPSNPGGGQQPKTTADQPPAGPAKTPVPPLKTPADAAPAPDATDAATPAPTDSTDQGTAKPSQGATLQQVLAADLLAHQVWTGNNPPTAADLNKLHILIAQTLESGGTQLSKSNLFFGSRFYYSGGAVATFALYYSWGQQECGGYALAYKGFLEAEDFEKEFESTKPRARIAINCK